MKASEPVSFREYVRECARNKELLAEFDRLNGTNLSFRQTPPIVQAIDMATGKTADDVARFLAFCWDTYQRLPVEMIERAAVAAIEDES